MKRISSKWSLFLTMFLMPGLSAGLALAAAPVQTMMPVNGEIERITIDNPTDAWSGGTMTVGGQVVIIPRNLLINLPNDYQTLQQIFANAPAVCKSLGESGLGKTDKCNGRATGAQVNILANLTSPGNNIIAGQIDIFKGLEIVNGTISYIDYADGYFRLNGNLSDPSTGVMVRVNDPVSRHTIQSGRGCAAGMPNCSPDVRFKIDPDNYTFVFATGYPPCIPTSAGGDVTCPNSNRPPQSPNISSNPFATPPVAADSRFFAPVKLGDSITATGSYETVNGVTFLSAWAVKVQVDLTTDFTRNDQPDYLFINVASWDGPAYPAGKISGRLLTTATDHNALIDYFSIHYDPLTNSPHEKPLYSVVNNKKNGAVIFNIGPTGVFDSQIRMDFFPGAPLLGGEPCIGLIGAGSIPNVDIAGYCGGPLTTVNNFNLMVPVFREVMARSRHQVAVGVTALDIHGRPTQFGQYKLPTTISYGSFEDINLGMGAFPFSFSGTPWLMDRRLSPNGCIGPCETTLQPLNPFPFEGIDPRTISPTFGVFVVGGGGKGGAGGFGGTPLPTPDRMFNFMVQDPVTGVFNMTGSLVNTFPPANPQGIPITTIPQLNLFAPDAFNDTMTTGKGVPVTINVLANDVATLGVLDPATVKIVSSSPVNGTLVKNFDGSINYSPAPTFIGTNTFTYTVANNFGSVSNAATVSVTVASPPVAAPIAASATTNATIPINIVANVNSTVSSINQSSVTVVSQPTCGTIVNPGTGSLNFTAPTTVPATGAACVFSYTARDSSIPPQTSNVATVTVGITAAGASLTANPDSAVVAVNATVTINVIANDTPFSNINPASIQVTQQPATGGGTATPNPLNNGTVNYTAPGIAGIYSFSYTVKDVTGLVTSAPAIVSVTVVSPPTANSFTATDLPNVTGASEVITIIPTNVVAGSNPVNPASIMIVSQPANGSAVVNANGTVIYTPNPGFVGSNSFTYTVKDTIGMLSSGATVTINVTAPPTETLAVTRAQFTVNGLSWRIDGTTTSRAANETIQIFNGPTVNAAPLGAPVPVNGGSWTLLLTNPPTQPDPSLKFSVQSVQIPAAKLEGITLVVR